MMVTMVWTVPGDHDRWGSSGQVPLQGHVHHPLAPGGPVHQFRQPVDALGAEHQVEMGGESQQPLAFLLGHAAPDAQDELGARPLQRL